MWTLWNTVIFCLFWYALVISSWTTRKFSANSNRRASIFLANVPNNFIGKLISVFAVMCVCTECSAARENPKRTRILKMDWSPDQTAGDQWIWPQETRQSWTPFSSVIYTMVVIETKTFKLGGELALPVSVPNVSNKIEDSVDDNSYASG